LQLKLTQIVLLDQGSQTQNSKGREWSTAAYSYFFFVLFLYLPPYWQTPAEVQRPSTSFLILQRAPAGFWAPAMHATVPVPRWQRLLR